MTLTPMVFQEEYGVLPKNLLTLYRKYKVSVADHDRLLLVADGDWNLIMELVQLHSSQGYLALPWQL